MKIEKWGFLFLWGYFSPLWGSDGNRGTFEPLEANCEENLSALERDGNIQTGGQLLGPKVSSCIYTAPTKPEAPLEKGNLPFCLSYPGNKGNLEGQTIVLSGKQMLSLEVMNCQDRTGVTGSGASATGQDMVAGNFVVAVDNSYSTCPDTSLPISGTDCSNGRKDFALKLLQKFEAQKKEKKTSFLAVAYGGQYTDNNEKKPCEEKDEVDKKWVNGRKLSYCQKTSWQNNTIYAQHLLDKTAPEGYGFGTTDLSYILESSIRDKKELLHTVMITDGLPQSPKEVNIKQADCKLTHGLRWNGKCYDLWFKKTALLSLNYVDGKVPFSLFAVNYPPKPFENEGNRFKENNLYNILYNTHPTSDIFYEYDSVSPYLRLYPDDYLIELSSKTGNGDVKFAYLNRREWMGVKEDEKALTEDDYLNRIFEVFNEHSIHHVDLEMNGKVIRQVSHGFFTKSFYIHLPSLPQGNTKAVIKTYYNDGSVGEDNITIQNNASYENSENVNCEIKKSTLTVIDQKNPKGYDVTDDGVLPFYNQSGQLCRVFRNGDDMNADPKNSSTVLDRDKFREGNDAVSLEDKKNNENLQIQGGMGNFCGAIGLGSFYMNFLTILSLFFPLVVLKVWKRGEK